MGRAKARRYLKSRVFWADREEGIDEFIDACERTKTEHPASTEAFLLENTDPGHDDQWGFYPIDD